MHCNIKTILKKLLKLIRLQLINNDYTVRTELESTKSKKEIVSVYKKKNRKVNHFLKN